MDTQTAASQTVKKAGPVLGQACRTSDLSAGLPGNTGPSGTGDVLTRINDGTDINISELADEVTLSCRLSKMLPLSWVMTSASGY